MQMANELVKVEHAAPAQRRSFDEILRMAETIAKSRLFGVTQVDQVVALMLMAEAEGRHVASAMQDYSVIQGKPSLKAEAMLARFQQAGGKVKWTELSDTRVAAIFSHSQCEPVEIDWDMQRARMAGLGGKDMWKKFPRQMLRARVISEGVRTAYPGALGGMYAPEEVIDFEQPTRTPPTPARGQLAAPEEPGQAETPREPPPSELDGEEVDQTTQPEWPILEAEMEEYSTREDLKAWWTTPDKKALKACKPHMMRAFYRIEFQKRWDELGETVQWTDEAGARG
jgi:hypothetical protein